MVVRSLIANELDGIAGGISSGNMNGEITAWSYSSFYLTPITPLHFD
jgi:hypothetical protein